METPPFSQEIYLRAVLDALPIPVFIADEETRIQDLNTAAAQMTGNPPEKVIKHLCGTVLHCLNESVSGRECGQTEHCPDCMVRRSVLEAAAGKSVVRRKAEMVLETNGQEDRRTFLISASPFEHEGRNLALVTIEDITEITDLRNILPICAHCRKIRNKDEVWENAERYIEKYANISFTHGICPDCMKELYNMDVSDIVSERKDNRE